MALLNAGSSVDVQDGQGCTPLHFAAAAASDDNAKYVYLSKPFCLQELIWTECLNVFPPNRKTFQVRSSSVIQDFILHLVAIFEILF